MRAPSLVLERRFCQMRRIAAALLIASTCISCTAPKTACDGLTYTAYGLGRKEYLPCAGQILDSMNRLRPQLEATVRGDKKARGKAWAEHATLKNLVSKAGERNLVERWEDEDLNRLNLQIWNAYTSYGAVLMFPNGTDLTAAEESHDQARRAYESLR